MKSRCFLPFKADEAFVIYDLRFTIYAVLGGSLPGSLGEVQENVEVTQHATVAPKSDVSGSRVSHYRP